MAKKNILTYSKKIKAEAAFQANRLNEARELFEVVCRTDKLDLDCWVRLSIINRRLKQFDAAEYYAREAVHLGPQFAEAYQSLAAALQCQGRLSDAIANYQVAVRLKPNFAEGHFFLANAYREMFMVGEAEIHYKEAIALRPDYLEALSNLGALLTPQGRKAEAYDYLNRALMLNPESPQILCNLATLFELESEFTKARELARQTLAYAPDFFDAVVLMAELEEKALHLDEAKRWLEKGFQADPSNYFLNMTAAKIARTEQRFQDAIDILEKLRNQKMFPVMEGDVYINLGKLYDRIGNYEGAFECFKKGNEVLLPAKVPVGFDRKKYLRRIEKESEFLTDRLIAAPHYPDDRPSPAFLLGFPRSGTTLLEQILDSHPRIQALDERPTVEAVNQAFLDLAGENLNALAELSAADVKKLRDVYWNTASQYTKLIPGNVLVDKMPLNTVYAHLIWRVFPDAKIILAIRHPCDVCLSCFMQNFAMNDAMSIFFTLEESAELYDKVMKFWLQCVNKLPLNFHRIRYEDVVADFEGEARHLLDFLGVKWDDAVLAFNEHAKTKIVSTPSYHQVTQPIYQHAKFRWKRYAKQMREVLPILAPYIEYFGYPDI